MKKLILFFLLAIVLVLGIGMTAYAVDIKVYSEQWNGAKYDFHVEDNSYNSSYNLSNNLLGFELAARRFYFGVENGVLGEVKYSSGDQYLTITDVRFGYRVVNNDVCTFDVFNSLILMNGIKTYDDTKASEELGGNLNFDFDDKVLLHGTCEIPLGGDIIAYNIKAGFLLTPKFAITVGYRGYELVNEVDNYDYLNDESTTSTLNGMTVGVEYKF